MSRADDDSIPELAIVDPDVAILDLLGCLQRAVLTHSESSRALFGALASEGRLFAQTEEGRRWKDVILRSRLLERALLVWQTATLWMTEDVADGAAPSALVDALAAAATSPRRDALLQRLFTRLGEEV